MANSHKGLEPMTDEQINALAPSVFAPSPWYKQSDRYSFVSTANIIDKMRENGFLPVQAKQSTSRIEGKQFFTKHLVRFRDLNAALENVGDYSTDMVLVNSHDGTSVYEISLGVFRLACLNGLMVDEGLVEAVKVRHTGNIIDMVLNATTGLFEKAPIVTNAIQTWKQIELSPNEQNIFATEAAILRYDDEIYKPTPDSVLAVRRPDDKASDLWTVFNRAQENLVRGGLKRTDATGQQAYREDPITGQTRRVPRTREIKGIDQTTKLNRALWALASKMAEIKTA